MTPPKKQNVAYTYALSNSWPAASKDRMHLKKISTKETYDMTPAEKASEPASTRLEAILTSEGKKTTAAPSAVEAPAPNTRAKAMTT